MFSPNLFFKQVLKVPIGIVFCSPTDSLLIDYQFTFSLLQEDDRHHTAINFIANPEQVRRSFNFYSVVISMDAMFSMFLCNCASSQNYHTVGLL